VETMTGHDLRRTVAGLAAAALTLVLAAAPAAGAGGTDITTRVTAGMVSEAMREFGYAAHIDRDGEGDPMILATIDGTRFGVVFFDCEKTGALPDRACTDVEFLAHYTPNETPSLASLNAWNAGNAFGKAYLRDDGDVALEMPVNLADGISAAYLESAFEWWESVRQGFEAHIGW